MGFLKKLKKVIKKIDPIGSKIADKTNKVVAKVASKDPITSKLMKIDPMMRNNSLGRALRGFNPAAEGLVQAMNPRAAAPPPVAPPVAAPGAEMGAPITGGAQMAAPGPMGPPMGGSAQMGPPMGGGVMPPGMGAPAPMPMRPPMQRPMMGGRGGALRRFGGGGGFGGGGFGGGY